jgi:actin-related protein
VGEEAM